MKYRKDFVTNSSSSSYICEICNNSESGMDMSLDDAGMVQCENGHTFCESHLLEPIDFYEEEDEDGEPVNEDGRYGIAAKYCPICQYQKVSPIEIVKYLVKTNKLDMLKEELKNNYKDYENFLKDIEQTKYN